MSWNSSVSPSTGGQSFSASFTYYGSGDTFGSANCQTNSNACGFYASPGFAAAVSQNLYGAGPGAGAGPACDTCYSISGQTDGDGNPIAGGGKTIVVKINNLCPAQGNPLCSQPDLSATNSMGAQVNFDLCKDSGAADAFFPPGGGLVKGTAQQLPDCSSWSGTNVQ